ncbi:mRNA turnover protein 4 homolog isoform X2 [Athalia rosae]|nr:mRNA turnover protein 4 homolog isoform X2 [Athalia rosae]
MRNNKLKDIRGNWKDSRFFFGKNKIMALGLGKSPEEEAEDGLHKLSAALKGQCGLLFTNRPKDEVLDWMEQYGEEDYARSGFIATESISIPEGPMPEFAHSIEPHLRQLGLPTSLQKGVVTLLKDHDVCKQGQTLTPEQARILKLIGRALATFKLTPLGIFVKNEGYTQIAEDKTDEEDDDTMETGDVSDT